MGARVSNFAAASLNRPSQAREVAKVLPGRTSDMRIAQIALVAAAVMSGFSATPNLATGFSTQSDFPTPASTVAATPARRIEVASVGAASFIWC
jgi:hypothetical protein